ncbi:MAG TPA: M28 family peptidase [Bacteroidota bacterium]|nr:M28 family peptidase [Bacteroidota bacterium]
MTSSSINRLKPPAFIVLALILLSTNLFSQTDEVLLRIPTDQFSEASRTVLTSLRVYQRSPEFLLVGADFKALAQLNKAHLNASIIDDRPWSDSYAVVGTHPGNKHQRTYTGLSCRVLHSSPDFDIVKAAPQVFEQLRELGYTCVEIERWEIPAETHVTHLPLGAVDRPNDFISDVIANVSDTVIRSTIQGLGDLGSRYWNNTNHDSVSRWVKARYIAAGIADVALDSFQYGGGWQANVVATIPGTVTPSAELIVGGHHDDMPSFGQAPGADDNASGTAAAIEMARVLKLINYQPAYTMRFMGYAAEEAGLLGSASYAQRARTANRDIRCMQNYDMIANRNPVQTDHDVYIVWYTTSEAYRDLHAAIMTHYTVLNPVPTISYRSGSDSYSFWQQNYRTVFCIERDFSPYYHTSNDLLQYLDIAYCTEIVKSGLAMLLTLDMMPASVAGLQIRDWGDGTSLYASWDSVQVPDWYRYKVYIGTVPGVYTSNSLVTTRWTRLNGLTAGTRYYVGVSIVDLAGREGVITELSGVPKVVPEKPTGVWVENYAHGALLTWRQNLEMDLQGYNIYRSIDSMTSFVPLTTQPYTDTLCIDTAGTAWPRFYFLTAIDSSGNESAHSDTVVLGPVVSVGEPGGGRPFTFRLEQNYPNPFNPMTNIGFEVNGSGVVSLKVFDVLGREIATLVDEAKFPGRYDVVWDATTAASGFYFYTLRSDGKVTTKRMLLVK